MRIGVSLRTSFPPELVGGDPRTAARWVVERARAAHDAGLGSLFVGDHHATGPSFYLQNAPLVGRLLAEWTGRTAGVLTLLPLWHPVLLAEQVGTLSALHDGPVVMQTAIGAGAEQFAAMGVPLIGRTARFEQSLDVFRRLLRGERVTATVGDLAIVDAAVAPTAPVDVWIGAAAPPAIARAARLGDGWICNANVVPDEARDQAREHAAACAALGRAPGVVAIRRDVHVGADDADAHRVADPVVDGGYRGFPPDAFTIGGIEAVAHSFRALAALGYTDVLVRQLATDQGDALASIERLGAVQQLVDDA